MPSTLQVSQDQVRAFELRTDLPLLLLPVRLETRFTKAPDQLLIRIYPDAVHVDSFEPRLTESEILWGHHYWRQTWLAENKEHEQNTWAQLAQAFGPLRAAWIARQLTPTNLDDRLRTKEPSFPTPPQVDPQSPHTPCTQLLPDQWVAVGYQYNKGELREQFRRESRTVHDHLPTLPAFEQAMTLDDLTSEPNDAWLHNPDGSWLLNFRKAEAVGMGIRVPAPPQPIDLLLVYGVRASMDSEMGRKQVEHLFQAHHYTQGMAFVAQGTPTNNTTTASSGYSSADPGSAESFTVERVQTRAANAMWNQAVLASALGIDQTCLVNVQGANAEEQRGARDMNNVLWQATWGYFLEEMLALKGDHSGDINRMHEHFVNFVRARGPLPALRVGHQPYGVLPVRLLGQSGGDSVEQGLRALREIWRESLRKKDERGDDVVPRLWKQGEPRGDRSEFTLTLLRILAMAPTGISYVGRPCTRVMPLSAPTSPEGLANTGQMPVPRALKKALDAFLGPNTVTPHQRTVFAGQSDLLSMIKPIAELQDFQGSGATSLFNLLRDKNVTADYLQSLSAVDREGLLKETLDLCSHRLDAWITSLATKRLAQLRQQHPQGISIGGYGWVENLVPDARAVEDREKDNYGFIHAPSLAHATTAAVLRSGYQSRRLSQTPTDGNALAVNLTSERVRLAVHLIDGVRGGQSLATLLGYRFERGLHEKGLDPFIPDFRALAPGSTELLATTDSNEESKIKLKNLVLDGLVLLDIYKEDKEKTEPEKKIRKVLVDNCRDELEALKDAVDAVADLALAESVHHVVQGNHVRAGATLDAIVRGEAPPPELEFIRTSRTGLNHTHRLSVVFNGAPTAVPRATATPRAQAEPVLNAWVARLLGPRVEQAFCEVTYSDPQVSAEPQSLHVSLKELGLAPLDLVYLLDGDLGGQQSEIEQRILYHVLKNRPSITNISLAFPVSPPGNPPGLPEVLEVTRTIRRLITGARGLEPRDLELPEQVKVGSQPDRDDSLVARASMVREAFVRATDVLRKSLPAKPEDPITDPQIVREAMQNLASYCLMGAVPVISLAGKDTADAALAAVIRLRSQAESVLAEATKRVQALSPSIQVHSEAVAVMKELFGEDFRVLTAFIPANGTDLNRTFDASTTLQGGNALESILWFQRVARVRDGAARLDAAMLYAEALNGPLVSFRIGQLPYQEGERWVALENPPNENRLSLACVNTGTIDFTKPVVGLLVDDWVETVPNNSEVTGLAFHFDAPQPRAPHALLLALAPEGLDKWDTVTLETTLCETLELAKLRAVDLTALGEVGQYLPALYGKHDPTTGKSPFANV